MSAPRHPHPPTAAATGGRPRARWAIAGVAWVALASVAAGCTSGDDASAVPGVGTSPPGDPTASTLVAPSGDGAPTDGAPDDGAPTDGGAAAPTTTDPVRPGGAASTTAPTTTAPPATTTTAPPTTAAPTTAAAAPRLLRAGDQGSQVAVVQLKLGVLGYLPPGTDTGVFDQATDAAVRRFQSDYALVVDGIVGPQTERSLTAAATSVNLDG